MENMSVAMLYIAGRSAERSGTIHLVWEPEFSLRNQLLKPYIPVQKFLRHNQGNQLL